MPRRKEQPGTWAWRIGALRCKHRASIPGMRMPFCGLAENPRRCTRVTCDEFGEEKKVLAVGAEESRPTKPKEEILAEAVNLRIEVGRRRNMASSTLLFLSEGMCPGSIADRLGIAYPEARKLWKEIAEEMGR